MKQTAVDYFIHTLEIGMDNKFELSDGRILSVSEIYSIAKEMEISQFDNFMEYYNKNFKR